ncbi:outer membrane transport energization protein TonB [Flavobacterium resistens]|uniref:Energy transducer TonB n=1 Tax=Flavobacterium resistens TaxID=443612 RepID=A0A521EV25_9FLAO|nr:energy transducer TonB [Flavobacterium resistens]MRX68050.1 energy transducer TonB [Flavobacterium resistens]SMO87782.1 outer membrane transport energization protein TonB [Flavobacterium resistens]
MSSTISSDQKKSLLYTTAIYAVIILLLFFIRFWPPYNPENNVALADGGGGGGGVTVNFGDSDLGSGANYKSEVLEVKNNVKQAPAKATPEEEAIISQENTTTDNDVVIPTKEKPKKPVPVEKPIQKPVPEKPKVSNSTNDALSSILKGSSKGGDGDDKVSGNKGKPNGDLNSKAYYGDNGSGGGKGGGDGKGNGPGKGDGNGPGSGPGSGGGSGYTLNGRKALSTPAPKYTCNEKGKVVVEVKVDRNGKTISATVIKGTDNRAPCLLEQAKIAAMNTKWESDSDAPVTQTGTITYNFSLN